MNSTISKTFNACSTESLFLRYNKNSKNAVKIGGFQYTNMFSIYISTCGMMAASEKFCERILWNHIMKNFQEKHGQCGSITFPKIFCWKL